MVTVEFAQNCYRGILAEFGDFSAVLPMVPVLKNIVRMGFIVGFWKKMYSRYIVHYIVNGKEGLLHIILARLCTLHLFIFNNTCVAICR